MLAEARLAATLQRHATCDDLHCPLPQLEQQAEIRDALRERLPGKQWIDVASKEDLLTASQRAAAKRISGGVIFVSSVTGEGMSALQEAVISAVEEVSADGRG